MTRSPAPQDRVLALMCGVSGLGALVGALAPMTPQAPVRLNAAMAATAAVLALLAVVRPSVALRHVVVVAHVLGVALLVSAAATPVGAVGGAVSLVWPALYSAFCLGRGAARACVALVAVSLTAALLANPFTGAAHVAFLVLLTTAAASEAVGTLVARLERLAHTDPLTGTLNREALRVRGQDLLARARREGREVSVAVVDLDGFKAVNDHGGHAAGDRLLVDLTDGWRRQLRGADLLARTGGDEFVLVLPDTGHQEAQALLHRLRTASPTGWSAGVASATGAADLEELVDRADRELYRQKAVRVPAQRRADLAALDPLPR